MQRQGMGGVGSGNGLYEVKWVIPLKFGLKFV